MCVCVFYITCLPRVGCNKSIFKLSTDALNSELTKANNV